MGTERVALVAALLLVATPAAASSLGGFVERVATRLAEASAAHVPPRVPPVPIKVGWAPRRRASIELEGSTLGAVVVLEAADQDVAGDERRRDDRQQRRQREPQREAGAQLHEACRGRP
mgnify:CR=1 FL=1